MASPQSGPEGNTSDALGFGAGKLGPRTGALGSVGEHGSLSTPQEPPLSQQLWAVPRLWPSQGCPGDVAEGRGCSLSSPHVLPGSLNFPIASQHFYSTPSPPFPIHPLVAGLLEASGVPELIKNSWTLPLNGGHHPFVPGQQGQLDSLGLK